MAIMWFKSFQQRLTLYSAIFALTTCLTGCHMDPMIFSLGWGYPSSLRAIETEWVNDRLEPFGVSLDAYKLRMHTNASGTLLVVWESEFRPGDFYSDRGDWSRRRYAVPFDSTKSVWAIDGAGWLDDDGQIVARQEGATVVNSTGQQLDLGHLVKPEVLVDDAGRFLCVYDDVMKIVNVYEVSRLDRPLGKFVSGGPPISLHLHRDRLIVYSLTGETPYLMDRPFSGSQIVGGMHILRFFRIERDVLAEDDPVIIPYWASLVAIDPEADRAVVYKSQDLPFSDYQFIFNFRTGRYYRLSGQPERYVVFVASNVQGLSGATAASGAHGSSSP